MEKDTAVHKLEKDGNNEDNYYMVCSLAVVPKEAAKNLNKNNTLVVMINGSYPNLYCPVFLAEGTKEDVKKELAKTVKNLLDYTERSDKPNYLKDAIASGEIKVLDLPKPGEKNGKQ